MGIGAGILIAAVGAVLAYAVTAEVEGVDINVVGVILIIAGLAIALFAAIATVSRRGRTLYDDDYVPPSSRI